MNAETIANEARKSISSYCINECKSFCCRKGILRVTPKEADLITKGKTAELEKSGSIVKNTLKLYTVNLGKTCPSLKDSKCTIHKDPGRPKMCHDYPLFVTEKSVAFSNGCPAVRNQLFFAYQKKFLKLGYTITSCK